MGRGYKPAEYAMNMYCTFSVSHILSTNGKERNSNEIMPGNRSTYIYTHMGSALDSHQRGPLIERNANIPVLD